MKDIDYIKEYINCKAKAYLIETLEDKPMKLKVHERRRKVFNDMILYILSEREINTEKLTDKVFKNLDYKNREKDYNSVKDSFDNFIYMLQEYEYKVIDPVTNFEIGYQGLIVNSRWDFAVQSEKTNYKYPAILDFSNARYDIEFNPVVYQAQTICDYMELTNTNTNIAVFSIGSGKAWLYNNKRYGQAIKFSLEETAVEILSDFHGVRFGFWCRTCYYRGICGSLLHK